MKRPVRVLAVLMALLALPLSSGAEIYRHVDENGNVTFSDRPGPGAEKIDLQAPSTYRPPPTPARREHSQDRTTEESEPVYRSPQRQSNP